MKTLLVCITLIYLILPANAYLFPMDQPDNEIKRVDDYNSGKLDIWDKIKLIIECLIHLFIMSIVVVVWLNIAHKIMTGKWLHQSKRWNKNL